MKTLIKKSKIAIAFMKLSLVLIIVGMALFAVGVKAAKKTTMTRKGDTVWFGYYPKTKATEEELNGMSANADADGFYTSGKEKFVKVTNAIPKEHYETANTTYIPFDDDSQPVEGATYYFKLEPIEWMVMVDDEEANTVKLVSRY